MITGHSFRSGESQAPAEPRDTPHEATTLLTEIARTQALSRRLYGYAQGAPHLIIWGVVWLVCNLGGYLQPDLSGAIWSAGLVAGISGSFLAGIRQYGARAQGGIAWRWAASILAVIAGMTALLWILQPRLSEQVNAAWSLTVAVAYILLGLWRGTRFLVLGLFLGAVVVVAWSVFRDLFPLAMAIAGGGALLLGGWWLLQEERG